MFLLKKTSLLLSLLPALLLFNACKKDPDNVTRDEKTSLENGSVELRVNGGKWQVMNGRITEKNGELLLEAFPVGSEKLGLFIGWDGNEKQYNWADDSKGVRMEYFYPDGTYLLDWYEAQSKPSVSSTGQLNVNENTESKTISGEFMVSSAGHFSLQDKFLDKQTIEGRFHIKAANLHK